MATNISSISLIDILPSSIKNDPQVQAAAIALDSELQATTAAIQQTILVPRIDALPEDVLDLLAWQFHVDFYDISLSIDKKRALVFQSINWHRRKGTPSAVEEVVSAAITPAQIIEWFQYGGQPYHFMVQTQGVMSSQAVYDQIRTAINTVKNVRSWLDYIQLQRTIGIDTSNGQKDIYLGFLIGQGGVQKIDLHYPSKISNNLLWGGVTLTGGTKKINISLPQKAPVSLYSGVLVMRSGVITIGGTH